jgi:hypothetical protein
MNERTNNYVTSLPNSGFRIGHLLNDLITGFILAECFNAEYLHSPLPQKWEDFFGFGEDEQYFDEILNRDRKNVSLISGSPLLGIQKIPNPLLSLHQIVPYVEYYGRQYLKKVPIKKISDLCNPSWGNPFWEGTPFEYFEDAFSKYSLKSDRTNIFCFQKAVRAMPYQLKEWSTSGKVEPHIYYKVLEKLRQKYHQKSHPYKESYFKDNVINVAIHIRREDATIENQRFLPLEFHFNIIRHLTELLQGKEFLFHVYSYGSEAEMNEIVKEFDQISPSIRYHLNQPAMQDLHHMIIADILVGSHSSFSDWAGFLSKNIKIYHPHFFMWDLDDHEWISADDGGYYDPNRLQEMLCAMPFFKTSLSQSVSIANRMDGD